MSELLASAYELRYEFDLEDPMLRAWEALRTLMPNMGDFLTWEVVRAGIAMTLAKVIESDTTLRTLRVLEGPGSMDGGRRLVAFVLDSRE